MGLKKILYYVKPFVMKNLFVILFFSIFAISLPAQEPVVFHYNFSFEKEYTYLTNDLNYFTISIFNPNGATVYKRLFENSEFVRDEYGYCLIADTLKTGLNEIGQYRLSIDYKLVSGFERNSKFKFKTNDSLKNISLEIFFDQAEEKTSYKVDTSLINFKEYEIKKNPKPALIVKYLKNNETVKIKPAWFEHVRLTRRPIYVLKNTSTDTIYRRYNNIFSGFWGDLGLWDSGEWKPYFFGGTCGTSGDKYIKPGEECEIVEAYSIGNPLKLEEGFYRYSVDYLDKNKDEKTAVTYFKVIYSK